jgi:hypothetical protein
MTNDEARLWDLVKSGNDRVAVLSRGECEAVMALLNLISNGDGEGSDVAYHLSETLRHRVSQLAKAEVQAPAPRAALTEE